ncbi:MAG TPA: 8-amino-7-oxononanoate synthase [Gammaproteobacteria bacterium]|jgi:8-amino-7-oxononanoate synthase
MSNESLDRFAAQKLESLARRNLRRELAVTDRSGGRLVTSRGGRLISFACNDYLGLSHHPDVVAASQEATARYGVGAGAARLITGNHPLYAELENKLAALKGTEDAVVFGSGYLTNIGVIPALVGPRDLIVLDELSHSCLLSGANLSRAHVVTFKHNDADDAKRILEAERRRHRHCLLITEGVFSMDGDLAPLPKLATLAARYDAWLMSDDAHGLGVVGGGRGATFAHDEPVAVPLQMGTLSKAVGGYGGYLCASRTVVELMRNRARSFVYSTGLPPGVVAAASKALEIIATDAALVARPLARARLFTATLERPHAESAIVALVLGPTDRALAVSETLRAAGYLVPAIRPPTVPNGTARLRIAFSALHSEADVTVLAKAVAAAGVRA